MPSKDHFIKGNAGQFAFYRVNYDAAGWSDIINQFNVSHQVREDQATEI